MFIRKFSSKQGPIDLPKFFLFFGMLKIAKTKYKVKSTVHEKMPNFIDNSWVLYFTSNFSVIFRKVGKFSVWFAAHHDKWFIHGLNFNLVGALIFLVQSLFEVCDTLVQEFLSFGVAVDLAESQSRWVWNQQIPVKSNVPKSNVRKKVFHIFIFPKKYIETKIRKVFVKLPIVFDNLYFGTAFNFTLSHVFHMWLSRLLTVFQVSVETFLWGSHQIFLNAFLA